jgi:hypothetical protein
LKISSICAHVDRKPLGEVDANWRNASIANNSAFPEIAERWGENDG